MKTQFLPLQRFIFKLKVNEYVILNRFGFYLLLQTITFKHYELDGILLLFINWMGKLTGKFTLKPRWDVFKPTFFLDSPNPLVHRISSLV